MKRRKLLGVSATALVGLPGCLADTEYTITNVDVEHAPGPLSFEVTVTDTDATVGSPAKLELTLTNERDHDVRIQSRGIWPLGVLEIWPTEPSTPATLITEGTRPQTPGTSDGGSYSNPPGPKARLWHPEYEQSGYVTVNGGSFSISATPLIESLGGQESMAETYELHGNDVSQGGTSYLRGIGYTNVRGGTIPLCYYEEAESGDWEPFLPHVSVTLTERGFFG